MVPPKAAPDFERKKGADQNRTGVRGFAGLCLTTRPRRQAAGRMVSRPSGSTPAMTQQSLLDSNETAAPVVPPKPTLPKLREAAAGCKACDLWKTGTQTVYGERAQTAQIMFVGEQPGDREDIEGRPFVGPAGRLLDNALAEAGIDRKLAYVTNAVKHFKWTPRGKRRIHQKPNWSEIAACRPWLDAELAVVKPRVLVCLGATAAQALLGRQFRVTRQRGEVVDSGYGIPAIATVHPSSILRAEDEDREHEFAAFVDDLATIKRFVEAA